MASDHRDLGERKGEAVFGSVFIDRRGTPRARLGGQLPGFLSEYLIGAYGIHDAGLLVEEHFPTTRTRNSLQYQLLQDGTVDVLDYLEVSVDLEREQTIAHMTALQFSCAIDADLLDQWPDLLSGGMWGRVKVSRVYDLPSERNAALVPVWDRTSIYDEPPEEPIYREERAPTVVEFVPYQVSVDVRRFVEGRKAFGTEEWIDLLLASSGYNPQWIRAQPNGRRLTRLYLSRLIPLVERNINLVELGPKNTGKTHLLRNLSPYAFTISGGQATPANLFVNLATKQGGLIQSRRVIVFDEVARLQFSQNRATLALLKDYMESGQFARGRASYGADTSLVFMGNLEVEGMRPSPRYRHLFEVLPRELQDTAVLDRLHGFIPGWEIPKLSPLALEPSFGLASDYFGEVLVGLRDWPYDDVWARIQKRWPERERMTRRDVTALDRMGRAFFKLVFPDGHLDDPVAEELLGITGEYRQRIHEQLVKIEPGEFTPYEVGFRNIPVHADGWERIETPLDRRLNRDPSPGAATGAVAESDANSGSMRTDVVIIQAVVAESPGQTVVMADPGIAGGDAVWKVARFFLAAHLSRLGLESRARWEGLGIQFTGGPGDLRGRCELALVLAIVSAWLKRPLPVASAAIGGITVGGDVTTPRELLPLVMAAANRGRKTILVPDGCPRDLLESTFDAAHYGLITFIPVAHAIDALTWAFPR